MTDQPNTDLLPCPNPWCGCNDKLGIRWELYQRQVVCYACGLKGPRSDMKPIQDAAQKQDELDSRAIELWNTRANLAPKVKPLIWHEDKKGSHTACPPEWRRCYVIVEFSMVVRWKYGVLGKWHDVDSLEAAKAEVQADYEHRMEPAIGMAPITPAQAAKVLEVAMSNGLDPFDVTENLEMESLAIRYAGNRGDPVATLEIAELFMGAALKAIAENDE